MSATREAGGHGLDVRVAAGGAVRFPVRVQPRASRTAIGGVREGALVVRLTAPPVDGAANAALVAALAGSLGVARRAVRLLTGATARAKVVEVSGVSIDAVRALADAGARPRGR